MKSPVSSCVQLCFVLLCVVACISVESKEPKRSKLSSEFGLTPFLRSGRASDRWDANAGEVKRRIGKMVSFPRIGRSDSPWGVDDNNYGAKRPGAGSGMWFGPRLGRVQKRNSEDYAPWTYIILNGDGPVSRQVHYTPRLGRESEEVYDDVEDETAA